MGTIRTLGKAERKYECDLMTIRINFNANGTDPAELGEKVMKECENFIAEIVKEGQVKASDFHMQGDEISKNIYGDKDTSRANRVISIFMPYDMRFQNHVRDILNKGKYHYSINVEYSYSKTNEMHAELVKEALLEAENQAKILADSLGLKIEGLKSAVEDGHRYANAECLCCEQERGISDGSTYELSDELSGSLDNMAVEVSAEWKVGMKD